MKTPWAILLCKFNDDDSEPFPRVFYERLFTTAGATSLNMVKFFADVSHGNLDLTESQVFPKVTASTPPGERLIKINKKRSEYVGSGPNWPGRLQLIDWAKEAAAEMGTDLSPFYGVVVCINVPTDLFGGGGRQAVCDNLSMKPSLLGQEMGHGYALDHSRADGSDDDYQDQWDVMSTQLAFMAADAEFGLIGPGLNAWNMRGRGWLDESRVWKGPFGGSETTLELRPLHRHDLPGFLAGEVGDGHLIEFRMRESWDGAIPRAAILVHRFSDNRSYIMRGTKGQQDLVAGDKFEIGTSTFTLAPYTKVEVVNIDTGARTATLHIQDRPAEKPPVYVPWPLYRIPRPDLITNLMTVFGAEAVTGGGLVDGGGWVIVGGKIIRVPSWDPTGRILDQLALFKASELAAQPWSRDSIRREALTAISAQIETLMMGLNPFRVPARPRQLQ